MKLIKNFLVYLLLFIIWLININFTSSVDWWSSPEANLKNIESEARPWANTQYDNLSNAKWIYWTLDAIRYKTIPYLKWAVYIGLSLAVILIVYNWFLMVLSPVTDEWYQKIQKRLLYIFFWVIWLTWFSLLITLVLSLVENLTS